MIKTTQKEKEIIRCEWGDCESDSGIRAIVEPDSDGNIECEGDGARFCTACKADLDRRVRRIHQ